jgi:hypothetical protein
VDEAALPPVTFVDDADSPTVALFTMTEPAETFTVAAIWSVAVEPALISPIVQTPVEVA